ncbi:MAG: phenylalanine 4-monooxygenase [Chloroflexi bacterium]|nr:phenylalanine 4-monooxygenase [Chloroflexota bacterium]
MSEIRRPFHQFTPEDDRIWSMLWDHQIANCQRHACRLLLEGLHTLGLQRERIPDFDALSRRLYDRVGWELVSTDVVYSDGQTWFEHLARRQFLVTEYIRSEDELLYTPLPDIWHDTFGHLPLMADQQYADYIEQFAHIALRYTPDERKSLGSLWWYTIEFGFLIEDGDMKALGAGLMSSPASWNTPSATRSKRHRSASRRSRASAPAHIRCTHDCSSSTRSSSSRPLRHSGSPITTP